MNFLTAQSQFIVEEVRLSEKLWNEKKQVRFKEYTGICEFIPIVKEFSVSSRYDGVQIRARLYQPKNQPAPLIIYAHGGGWIYGGIESHEALCRRLALRTECSVLAVEYRLAPKHKFPIAINDFQSIYEWVIENKSNLDILNHSIIFAGDSAGGNIVAATTCQLIKERKTLPEIVLLIYPVLDLSFTLPSINRFGFNQILTKEIMISYRDQYINDHDNISDWLLSPLFFDEFENFPDAVIVTAGCDLLSDDGKEFAGKLAKKRSTVEFNCFPGLIHGFINCHEIIPEAESALQWIGIKLHRLLKTRRKRQIDPYFLQSAC